MARRSSQNMSRKACAEHEIWDPFSKLHPMQLSGRKAMVDTRKNQWRTLRQGDPTLAGIPV
jgi:hypothetical protein